jgi:hypothetical protein
MAALVTPTGPQTSAKPRPPASPLEANRPTETTVAATNMSDRNPERTGTPFANLQGQSQELVTHQNVGVPDQRIRPLFLAVNL